MSGFGKTPRFNPLPPRPVSRAWSSTIRRPDGDPVVNALVSLGEHQGRTERNGRVRLDGISVDSHRLQLEIEPPDDTLHPYSASLAIDGDPPEPPFGDVEWDDIWLERSRVVLPRLVPRGQFFGLETGERWTAIECSDFALYARFLANEDIEPILEQRAALGFNLLRVWLLNTSVYRILPSEWPTFYDHLGAFCDRCAAHGLYVEFTALTQTQTLMPDPKQQQIHLAQIGAALLGSTNAILSLVNEADQHDNRPAPGLGMPPVLLCSCGSNGADAEPIVGGEYEEYHTNGLPEWWRKGGHNAREWANLHHSRVIAGENTRCPDQDANPDHFEDAAEAAALLCLGSCFHSTEGKVSQLFSGDALTCATAHVRGARNVPLDFQDGAYSRITVPPWLRVYTKTLQDGRAYTVRIRA